MIGFLLAAALLFVLGAALLLSGKRLRPRAADQDDANLAWYRQRSRELDGEEQALLEEARLRLVEDGATAVNATVTAPDPERGSFPVLILVAVISVLCVAIYWKTGSIEDVLIYDALVNISPDAGDYERDQLLQRIEERSRVKSDNLQYLGLLGRLHMAAEDYPAASRDFAQLAELAPQDPQALAMAAQARFLAAGRQLDTEAQLLAEKALAVDPMQRTALGLLGMASFEAQEYSAAITYWGRLQAMEPPDSPGYEMLGEVLALARERGGLAPDTAVLASASAATSPEAPGISVELTVPDSVGIDPTATVFVFARAAGSQGGMPVAVKRLQASQLPVTLRLGDADAMAGQLLSQAGEVLVSAQISRNGQPGVANALLSGVAGPVSAVQDGASVRIELRSPEA